jgi:glutamyl-Q tRNA(Asp) synthetase
VYPGCCRGGTTGDKPIRNYRLKIPSAPVSFLDELMGQQTDDLAVSVGDFAIMNGSGQYHYQLATVVDDEQQQISEAVRGSDLLGSTGRQIHLQNMLGYNRPAYFHLPVITDRSGTKLSKQHGAPAIDNLLASQNLINALNMLQQQPPVALNNAAPGEILAWAKENWQAAALKKSGSAPAPLIEG